jgi:hypothetical protein
MAASLRVFLFAAEQKLFRAGNRAFRGENRRRAKTFQNAVFVAV